VNIARLAEAMEADATLPQFAFGGRPLLWVFIFALACNDAKGQLRELSYGYLLSVARGPRYRAAVSSGTAVAPASVSVADGDVLFTPCRFDVSVAGAAAFWHHVCCSRRPTLDAIIAFYGRDVDVMTLSYNRVRGFGCVGLQQPPAPSPAAFWCLLSWAQIVFYQLTSFSMTDDPRPEKVEDELLGASYWTKGGLVMGPQYTVELPTVPKGLGVDTEEFRAAARRRFSSAIADAVFGAVFPFANPIGCIHEAYINDGAERALAMDTNTLVLTTGALLTAARLDEWLCANDWKRSTELKTVAIATLHQHLAPAFVAATVDAATPHQLVGSLLGDREWPSQTTAAVDVDGDEDETSHYVHDRMHIVFGAFEGSQGKFARRLVVFMLRVVLRGEDVDGDPDSDSLGSDEVVEEEDSSDGSESGSDEGSESTSEESASTSESDSD
jgi:hypothetical protein